MRSMISAAVTALIATTPVKSTAWTMPFSKRTVSVRPVMSNGDGRDSTWALAASHVAVAGPAPFTSREMASPPGRRSYVGPTPPVVDAAPAAAGTPLSMSTEESVPRIRLVIRQSPATSVA